MGIAKIFWSILDSLEQNPEGNQRIPERIRVRNDSGQDYEFEGETIAETSMYRGQWRVFKTAEGNYVLNYGKHFYTEADVADSEEGLLKLLESGKPWRMEIRGCWDPDLAKKELADQLYKKGLTSMAKFVQRV